MKFDESLWANARELEIALEALPPELVVSGNPMAGSITLLDEPGLTLGVWEITPGVSIDTEVDEVFVVVSGQALLRRTVGSSPQVHSLRPGVVVRLVEGEQTTWDVKQTLRKIYWISP